MIKHFSNNVAASVSSAFYLLYNVAHAAVCELFHVAIHLT